ncbi:alpha/beta fold hydrolase [Actinomadura sp. HBU206391]|uniref:alpha/beta fold hydrolase n=1 Tax=Actinomadura sp. HBU206391 TaxID=2731692 RepID=UPI001C9D041B|nr:alpha/beta fold hydrolase [Actinomadura sp. HBU206391]
MRSLLSLGAVVVLAASGTTAASAATRDLAPPQAIRWKGCPSYSDAVLRGRGLEGQRAQEFRRLLARTECGTLEVPLDYRRPRDKKITIAVTRLKAADPSRRLGALALNSGGPGGAGYLMPIDHVMMNSANARLNHRYDLIGFDPRGVGNSDKVDCPPADEGKGASTGGKPAPGPLTEEAARQIYQQEVAGNQACSRHDPQFLGQLTTANIARDMDRIRAALGERKLNFLALSWGTWLGAVYRSMFPHTVGRMWLDSIAIPRFSTLAFEQGRAEATERNCRRMADWMAERHATYGFGTSGEAVQDTLLALRRHYEADPRTFTDLDIPVTGGTIGMLCAQTSLDWPLTATALRELYELRDTPGSAAPPALKQIYTGNPVEIPPDAPEEFNQTMNRATFCNEDTGLRDFASVWSAWRQRLERNPLTGDFGKFSAMVGCAGWTLPVTDTRVRDTGTSLQMSGHLHETMSPYTWTTEMQEIIGGAVLTVDDDVHGSVLMDPACGANVAVYFESGRLSWGRCSGMRP